jgi:uncharacterized protein (TIGR04222 family)
MRQQRWLILVVVLLVTSLCVPTALAASDLAWNRTDVDIQINPDGTLTVTENYDITFGNRTFRKGFATIPQGRGSLSNVKVWEGDQSYAPSGSNAPYTFETSTADNGDLDITWYFPPTSNSRHQFNVQYTVEDGILYYPEEGYDRLQWIAVPGDHDWPILASRVTVHTPQGAPILRVGVANDSPATAEQTSANRAVFEATRPLKSDQGIEVRVDFEHGVVAGSPPAWQTTYDLRDQYGALFDVLGLFLGVFVAVAGSLLVLVWWYTRGRDPQTVLAAEYLSEPPSDLPPGVAGTLLDEKADVQDVLATVIDLARRGVVTMEEIDGAGSAADYVFRRVSDADLTRLRPYEKTVLDIVVPGAEQHLSSLKYKLYNRMSPIKKQLYQEVVKEKLFPRNPDDVRTRWIVGGTLLLVAAFGLGLCAFLFLIDLSFFLATPFCALGVVGVMVISVAAAMPRKTRFGAEEAAKWRAFKFYMQNLEKYTQVQEAAAQFDRYLPYAIAFGIDRSWIRKFKPVQAMPIPIWYFPRGYYRGGYHDGGRPAAGEFNTPSVQGMSDGLAGSFQGMSDGLSNMLNSASSTFTSVPSSKSSGHGWSGGGFSGGFGGGGGSRGFG